MSETFDVLIVGGGSAGAVLANRLSEDGTRRIILLGGGSAYSPNLSEAHPELHWYFGRYVYPSGRYERRFTREDFGSRIPPSLPREGASCDPVTARTPIPPKASSLETPEGPLFEPGLLSLILSTLTGEHVSAALVHQRSQQKIASAWKPCIRCSRPS